MFPQFTAINIISGTKTLMSDISVNVKRIYENILLHVELFCSMGHIPTILQRILFGSM